MSKRSTRLVLAGLLATIAAIAAIVLAAPSHQTHAPQRSAAVRRVGPLSHGTIRFALTLRLRERALDKYLADVRPSSGRPVPAARFGARFGQSTASLARLRRVLAGLGITVDHTYPQRTAMLVHADISSMRRDFALRFERYRTPADQRYFAPDGPPRIPAVLTPYISGLGDLSSHPLVADDIPESGLVPSLTARAYDITPLWNAGLRGEGETVAIATEEGAINPADLQAFAQKTHTAASQIQIVPVDGGSTYNPQQGSDSEVDLDFQVILGLIPRAHIIDYQGSDGSRGPNLSLGHSLADIYNRIEQDGKASIVTTSYGLCEAALAQGAPGDQQLIDNSLKALEASNVTVFESTGDTGAYACLQSLQIEPATNLPSGATGLSVQTPSSTPYAVAVGGTRVELRANGTYLKESAWSDPLERSGGGGGVSRSEPRPVWQQGPGVIQPRYNPSGHRQTPDVAGPADPNSGFLVCGTQGGSQGPSCNPGNGGTSAAAPFWAASLALVQEYAAAHGAGALAHCFAGPILYDLAASKQPVPPFHQVIGGNNGYYPATRGWNFATGLGTPDVFNLAQDYAHFLHGQSSNHCPF